MSRGCFKTAIKRFLKTERSRLKARYVSGESTCPVHVDPQQWKKLQAYWQSEDHISKVDKMTNARRSVKDNTNVGRKGKFGKGNVSLQVATLISLIRYKL